MFKKIKYLVLFLILAGTGSRAQSQKTIDSLKQLMTVTKHDTDKINLLYNLSRQYNYEKSGERLDYLIAALKLAKKTNYKPALKKMYFSLITILYHRGMYDISMNYCIEYLDYLEKEGEKEDILKMYNRYGSLLSKQGKYSEALQYYTLSKNYYLNRKEYGGYANALTNIFILQMENNQLDSALLNALRAEEIFKKDSAYSAWANVVVGLGDIYLLKKDYINARDKAWEAFKIYDKINETHGKANSLLVLAKSYTGENHADSSLIILNGASAFISTLNYTELKKELYKTKSDAYLKLNKYKETFENYVIYKQYDDSMSLEKTKAKMLELEVKHDLVKKEVQLKDQETQIELKNKQARLLIATIAGVIICLLISLWAYQQKKNSNKIILGQKKLVDEKQQEILASIRYAKRIQNSLLPTETSITKIINDLKSKK